MEDFSLDTKIVWVAVLIWVVLAFITALAPTGSPLMLLAQSADMVVLVWLIVRNWKRTLR